MTARRTRAIRIIKVSLFSAGIVPAFVGGALAYSEGSFSFPSFLLLVAGLFLGQAGGDYLYYYFTHYHTDPRDSHTKIFAGWRPLFAETVFPGSATIYAGFACLALAAAIGLYFALQVGYAVVILAMLAGAIAVFFTPLMLRGYKEPVIFVTFGPLSVLGVYLALTGSLSWSPVVASLPVAFLVTVVAYLKGAHFTVAVTAEGTAGNEGDQQAVVDVAETPDRDLVCAGLPEPGRCGGTEGDAAVDAACPAQRPHRRECCRCRR